MSNIEIQASEIKLVDPESLIPNVKNNNRHPKEQYDRLKKIISRQGFRVPITVSKRSGFIVCGHLRHEIALQLGMKLVPVIYQDFESEAIEYAHLTAENEVARWAELDKHAVYTELENLELDDIELLGLEDFTVDGLDELTEDELTEKYTRKVETPIYEPKGEKPEVVNLYDLEVVRSLLDRINDREDLPDDVKSFLVHSAYRHTKFNYKNIAEFYAHASPDVKDLMEDSALVIVDFDKAIELGFVKLTGELKEAYENEKF